MGWTGWILSRRWSTTNHVLDLKQASVTKHTDLDDKLYSRTTINTKMKTTTMQELELEP
jgi:hypothetical protein